MTNIILIRHGQSEGNLHRLFLGHTDLPLTELGHAQAEATAELLKDAKIDAFYASDLKRAFQTGEHIAARHGKVPTPDKRLREIYAGDWEGQPFADLPQTHPEIYNMWKYDLGKVCCPNGESIAELQVRIKAAIEDIVAHHPNQTVCLAIHAATIRVMECLWRGRELLDIPDIPWVPNASVTAVRYEDDGSTTLLVAGYAQHLEGLETNLPKNI